MNKFNEQICVCFKTGPVQPVFYWSEYSRYENNYGQSLNGSTNVRHSYKKLDNNNANGVDES